MVIDVIQITIKVSKQNELGITIGMHNAVNKPDCVLVHGCIIFQVAGVKERKIAAEKNDSLFTSI